MKSAIKVLMVMRGKTEKVGDIFGKFEECRVHEIWQAIKKSLMWNSDSSE